MNGVTIRAACPDEVPATSVAPKLVDNGVVSPYLVLEVKPMTWCAWAKWSKYNLRRAARTD
jgi:hypothetical protein